MSLTARQCRALDSIERQLGAREPRLASMFAMFTRLTKDELLPAIETIQVRRWQWFAAPVVSLRRMNMTRFISVAFVPFLIFGLVATALAVGSHGSATPRCGLIAGYHSAGVANVARLACGSRPSPPSR